MVKATLKSLKQFLESQDMKCTFIPKSEEIPIDQVFVYMGQDDSDRDLLLQIRVVEQELEGVELQGVTKKNMSYHHMHFLVNLPLKINEHCIGDVARMVLLLNKSLSVPGFEFSEVDRMVYYRYVLMTSGGRFNGNIVMSIIGMIMFNIDVFSKTIEDVGTGARTLVEVVEEAQKAATQ